MVNMIGYCEICHAIYETKQIQFSNNTKNATFGGGSIGTCEDDGGRILIPSGTFNVENDVLKYTELNESEEVLKVLNVLYQFSYEKSVDNLREELEKVTSNSNSVMEWIFKIFKVTGSMDLAVKLVTTLMMLGLGISADELFDKLTTSDDEERQLKILRNQTAEEKRENKIIKQNKQILDKLKRQEKRQQYRERKSTVVSKKKKVKKKK